jgi:signal peptidase I
MIPALNVNDFVVVSNIIPFSKLKVGDIIVFTSVGSLIPGERHETIVHRIVRITTTSRGDEIIRTKGDANSHSIPFIDYPIRKQNYIGKVIYVFPKLGLITRLTNPPTNYFIIAGVIIYNSHILHKNWKERMTDANIVKLEGGLFRMLCQLSLIF